MRLCLSRSQGLVDEELGSGAGVVSGSKAHDMWANAGSFKYSSR